MERRDWTFLGMLLPCEIAISMTSKSHILPCFLILAKTIRMHRLEEVILISDFLRGDPLLFIPPSNRQRRAAYRHLSALKEFGIISSVADGRCRKYALNIPYFLESIINRTLRFHPDAGASNQIRQLMAIHKETRDWFDTSNHVFSEVKMQWADDAMGGMYERISKSGKKKQKDVRRPLSESAVRKIYYVAAEKYEVATSHRWDEYDGHRARNWAREAAKNGIDLEHFIHEIMRNWRNIYFYLRYAADYDEGIKYLWFNSMYDHRDIIMHYLNAGCPDYTEYKEYRSAKKEGKNAHLSLVR